MNRTERSNSYEVASSLNPELQVVKVNPFSKISPEYAALFAILLIRVATDWQQKSLGYFYGFQGVGLQAADPKYEMSVSFPQLDAYYGFLSGIAYNLPYSVFGLFAGYLTRFK